MRLIDADPLLKGRQDHTYISTHEIWNAPTVDAEPIVRCKDCRWGRKTCGNVECRVDLNAPPEYHGYDWFCPNGERR